MSGIPVMRSVIFFLWSCCPLVAFAFWSTSREISPLGCEENVRVTNNTGKNSGGKKWTKNSLHSVKQGPARYYHMSLWSVNMAGLHINLSRASFEYLHVVISIQQALPVFHWWVNDKEAMLTARLAPHRTQSLSSTWKRGEQRGTAIACWFFVLEQPQLFLTLRFFSGDQFKCVWRWRGGLVSSNPCFSHQAH